MVSSSIRASRLVVVFALAGAGAGLAACGEDASDSPADPPPVSLGDAGYVDAPEPDADKARVDGGFTSPDGGVIRADRFVTEVVRFTPGPCAGFGAAAMPDVVLGPPVGGGALRGSLDVVTLGIGGEIVLSFEPNEIVDGPGDDFIVFENAFYVGGDPSRPVVDLGEVSVSEDGVTWHTYACTPGDAPPYGACAGWTAVYSAPGNGVSPVDPATAGGEAYDLSALGLARARFVRIRDASTATCEGTPKPNTAGFDLDAIAIVHAANP